MKRATYKQLAILCAGTTLAAALGLKYVVPLLPHHWLTRLHATNASTKASPLTAVAAIPAPIVPLMNGNEQNTDPWTGVILAETVEVSTRFEGKLATVRVRPGDIVHEGDVLAELDTKVQQQEMAAAQAALRASRAEAWSASAVYSQARERMTRRGGSVTVGSTVLPVVSAEEQSGAKFESSAAASRASAAGATADERKVRLEQLKLAMNDSTLRAPFDGVVSARYLDPGARVQPSMPIVRVVGRGSLRVRFAVPEDEASLIALGSRISLVWDNREGMDATVDRIAPEVESSSGTIFVEATLAGFAEENRLALAGRVVAVRLAVSTRPLQ